MNVAASFVARTSKTELLVPFQAEVGLSLQVC